MAVLDAGAEEFKDNGDTLEIHSDPKDLQAIRDALKEAGNVICGNVLPKIFGREAVFDLEPPEFIPDLRSGSQLAAISSGLASLTLGASRCFEGGLVTQTVVEMDRGFLFVMSISDGSCLAVLAASTCNVGVVAYEMTVLVARAGDVLTPSLRAELQAILPT